MPLSQKSSAKDLSEKAKLIALGRLRGAIHRSPRKARTPATLRALGKALQDRNTEVSDYAAAVIEDLEDAGRPMIPALVRAMRRRPCYAIASGLAGIGIAALPALRRLTTDRDVRVREIAAWALDHPRLNPVLLA